MTKNHINHIKRKSIILLVALSLITCFFLIGYTFNLGIEVIMTDPKGIKEFGNWWPVIVLAFIALIVFDSKTFAFICILLYMLFYTTDDGKEFIKCMNNPDNTLEVCVHQDLDR